MILMDLAKSYTLKCLVSGPTICKWPTVRIDAADTSIYQPEIRPSTSASAIPTYSDHLVRAVRLFLD